MKHCLVYALLLLLPLSAMAQDDEYYQKQPKPGKQPARPVYTIVLRDGTKLRGDLLRKDSTETVIQTKNIGEVRLRTEQIMRIDRERTRGGDGVAYPNLFPQTMRLAPTAFQAEKGRVYFRNYFISLSQFEYGINDNWSVGTTFLTFLPTNLFSLNTKVSFPVGNRVRLGVNAQYVALRFGDQLLGSVFADIGYLQGIVTTGDQQNNTTYGLGWSIAKGDVSRNIVGTFGLVRKVSPKLTFISENFVLFGGRGNRAVDFAGALSGGIRFDRRRHAFDLAVYLPVVIGNRWRGPVTPAPFASYHLRIGK